MPSLTIMRHGRAEEGLGLPDHERALTDAGREQLIGVAAGLAALGVAPNLILSSPYRRTMETAQALATRIAPGSPAQAIEELGSGMAPAELMLESIVRAAGLAENARSILVVGHLPDVSYLTGLIVSGQPCRAVDFAPATAAHMACLGSMRAGAGTLLWALRADALTRLGAQG